MERLTDDQRACLSVIEADPDHVAWVEVRGVMHTYTGYWTPLDVLRRLSDGGRPQASPDRRLRELVQKGVLIRVTPDLARNRVLYSLPKEPRKGLTKKE